MVSKIFDQNFDQFISKMLPWENPTNMILKWPFEWFLAVSNGLLTDNDFIETSYFQWMLKDSFLSKKKVKKIPKSLPEAEVLLFF